MIKFCLIRSSIFVWGFSFGMWLVMFVRCGNCLVILGVVILLWLFGMVLYFMIGGNWWVVLLFNDVIKRFLVILLVMFLILEYVFNLKFFVLVLILSKLNNLFFVRE